MREDARKVGDEPAGENSKDKAVDTQPTGPGSAATEGVSSKVDAPTSTTKIDTFPQPAEGPT